MQHCCFRHFNRTLQVFHLFNTPQSRLREKYIHVRALYVLSIGDKINVSDKALVQAEGALSGAEFSSDECAHDLQRSD
jgi:hypothetical protein